MSSFSNKKSLRFIISLGTTTFTGGGDQVELNGFRSVVEVDKAAGMSMGSLRARIYGVKETSMHTITTIALQTAKYAEIQWMPNTITVFAIDGEVETVIFQGNIVNAWADYQSMPDVFLHIQAQSATFGRLNPIPPKSFKGSSDVAVVMEQIAKQMGLKFENNGVNVQVQDLYLENTALIQAQDLARMAGITMVIDNDVMAICPINGSRATETLPEISAAGGMVGYPTIDAAGVTVTTLFNPSIVFMRQFSLISDQVRATGTWVATSISLRLESERPGGAWFMTVRGNFEGTPYVGK